MTDDLPTAIHELPRLQSLLTERFLLDEAAPFAWPESELAALERFTWFRLPGVDRDAPQVRLPATLLSGLVATRAPFGFLVSGEGETVTVAVGTLPARAVGLAPVVQATLGGPSLQPFSPPPALFQPAHVGCLAGQPLAAGNPGASAPGGPSSSVIDVVLSLQQGGAFFYTLFATPEPRDLIAESLARLRRAVERVERQHLQLGAQTNIDRNALRARELLDLAIGRTEAGLGSGLWCVSAIIGGSDDATVDRILGMLAGAFEAPVGPDTLVPLRALRCRSARMPGGEVVHRNRLSSRELSTLCALPARDRFGFVLARDGHFDVDHPEVRDGIQLGRILDGDRLTKRTFGVTLATLCRHAFVTGMTGSGKSTTLRSLLTGVWRRGKPFLVLEPAKAEYRRLASIVPDLVVLQVGAPLSPDRVPFQFNPFYFPAGFPLHTHLDYLKQAFIASFGLIPPTPYLLETALYRVYEKRGWSLTTGEHPNGRERLSFPTLSDLHDEIDPVVDAAGYDSELSRNLKGALRTRIGNLCIGPKGAALDTRENLPESFLFDRPVVIELKDIGSDDEKALVMGLILTRLYEYREGAGAPPNSEELRHVLILEEAHRLVKRTTERAGEEGNMAHHAVQTFTNLLAEIRAYGQGVIVAEQLPAKLAPDVIKNAGLKIVHRLSPREDRDMVGDSMVLDERQKRDVAVLGPGVAVVHYAGIDGPLKIRVPAPPPPSTAAPTAPARVPLPAALEKRVYAILTRVPFSALLRRRSVRYAADRLVFRIAAGESIPREASLLGTAVEPHELPSSSGQKSVARDLFVRLAVVDALERRALAYGWTDALLDRLAEDADGRLPQLVAHYRAALDRKGPYHNCRACPQACTALYEARQAVAIEPYLEELGAAAAGSSPQDDITSVTSRHAGDVYDVALPTSHALRYCLAREGLERLGVSRQTAWSYLSKAFPPRSGHGH